MAKPPLAIWTELQALSLRFRREDHARQFVLRRTWLVIPLGIVFFIASVGCALGVAMFLMTIAPAKPMATWHKWPVVLLAVLTFFGAAVTQAYVLFAWLERLAARQESAPRPLIPGMTDPSLPKPHSTAAFAAVTIFLAVPLVMFGSAFPSSAALIGSSTLVGMLLYMVAS
jgi:hypothetical protein